MDYNISMPLLNLIVTYFLTITTIAGLVTLWNKWLNDHLNLRKFITKKMGPFAPMLTCDTCFTFWCTLAFVFIFSPLGPFILTFTSKNTHDILSMILIEWMSLGFGALTLRVSFRALQKYARKKSKSK